MGAADALKMLVKPNEDGLVRLFAVDLPPREALDLKDRPGALPEMLGVAALDPAHWELFDLADLAGMGLESYLADGHGISEGDLSALRWQIDALEGAVFLVRSAALPDKPVTLTPRAPLRWIATFGEERPPVPIRADLPSASARGGLSLPPTSGRGPRGSLVVLVLGVILTAAIALALYLLTRASTAG